MIADPNTHILKIQQRLRRRGSATLSDIRLVESLLRSHPRHARLWILRGALITLSRSDNRYSLLDALSSYKRAIQCQPDYADGYAEAGYHHFYVRDDPYHALPYFKKALKLKNTRSLARICREAQQDLKLRRKHHGKGIRHKY